MSAIGVPAKAGSIHNLHLKCIVIDNVFTGSVDKAPVRQFVRRKANSPLLSTTNWKYSRLELSILKDGDKEKEYVIIFSQEYIY